MEGLKTRASTCLSKLGTAHTLTDVTNANPMGVIVSLMDEIKRLETALTEIANTNGVLPDQVQDLRKYLLSLQRKATDVLQQS